MGLKSEGDAAGCDSGIVNAESGVDCDAAGDATGAAGAAEAVGAGGAAGACGKCGAMLVNVAIPVPGSAYFQIGVFGIAVLFPGPATLNAAFERLTR